MRRGGYRPDRIDAPGVLPSLCKAEKAATITRASPVLVGIESTEPATLAVVSFDLSNNPLATAHADERARARVPGAVKRPVMDTGMLVEQRSVRHFECPTAEASSHTL